MSKRSIAEIWFGFFEIVFAKKEFLKESIIRTAGNKNPFSRDRKLTFDRLFYMILDVGRETLALKIRRLFEHLKENPDDDVSVTQQAFSKARGSMNEMPFVSMHRRMIKAEYNGEMKGFPAPPVSRFGFRIFALDGTKISLPNLPFFRDHYFTTGSGATSPTALGTACTDICTNRIIAADFSDNNDERAACVRILDGLKDILPDDGIDIVLLQDRGYPSEGYIAEVEKRGFRYCMRAKDEQNKQVKAVPVGGDVVLTIGESKVRVLKFTLDSGIIETIVTNLYDMAMADFKELYFLRWGVETKYLSLKKRLRLESFTGKTDNSVKQDFWATILADTMLTIFEDEAREGISLDKEECKYEYKTNRSILVGEMKTHLFAYFESRTIVGRMMAMRKLQKAAREYTCPIRPGRSTPRSKNKRKTDASFNNKMNV